MEAPQRASVHLAGGGHDVAEPHSSGLWPNHPCPGACPNAVFRCIWTHPGLPQPWRETMGKIIERDPSIPNMSIDDAVAFCHRMGLNFITSRAIKTAIYSKSLRRHLVVNRVRLSENDIRTWIASTADADFIVRHSGRAS